MFVLKNADAIACNATMIMVGVDKRGLSLCALSSVASSQRRRSHSHSFGLLQEISPRPFIHILQRLNRPNLEAIMGQNSSHPSQFSHIIQPDPYRTFDEERGNYDPSFERESASIKWSARVLRKSDTGSIEQETRQCQPQCQCQQPQYQYRYNPQANWQGNPAIR